MNTNFTELSMVEMETIEGGKWHWYDVVITAYCPSYGVAKVIYDDLSNCYWNGYAEGKAQR